MGERFAGMHIALFSDALRLARRRHIRLILDVKDEGIRAQVMRTAAREGMLARVQFNGDVFRLARGERSRPEPTVWVQPGVTAQQVKRWHEQDRAVVANFSANGHEMDLAGMKAAVAAGVDAINVDFPRLGADAVHRPVETRLRALMATAAAGPERARIAAILELSRYRVFVLQADFARWLLDPDRAVSRAAALALVNARPRAEAAVFGPALRSEHADARVNAAWALGMLHAPAGQVLFLLRDPDPEVLQATLLSLARMPGEVSAAALLPFLSHADSRVRGAAALALARHQPGIAVGAIIARLQQEVDAEQVLYARHMASEAPDKYTQAEIRAFMNNFSCRMELVRALDSIDSEAATRALEGLAFHPDTTFSQYDGIVAGFQLWDRIGSEDAATLRALASGSQQVADRAEWILVKAGPAVLPGVRAELQSKNREVRRRAMRIVAWQGDTQSLPALRRLRAAEGPDASLAGWAIAKIEALHPAP